MHSLVTAGCADLDEEGDPRDEDVIAGGKSDAFGLTEGSPDALGITVGLVRDLEEVAVLVRF